MWVISCSPAAGGTENGEDDSKKATEEELSFIKSSICKQWKKLGVCIHKKNCLRVKPKPLCLYLLLWRHRLPKLNIRLRIRGVWDSLCI